MSYETEFDLDLSVFEILREYSRKKGGYDDDSTTR
jgi:hypothetical protein